jgi:hypothetical protein
LSVHNESKELTGLRFIEQVDRKNNVTELLFQECEKNKLLRIEVYSMATKVAARQKAGIFSALFKDGQIPADNINCGKKTIVAEDDISIPKFTDVQEQYLAEQTRQKIDIEKENARKEVMEILDDKSEKLKSKISSLEEKVKKLGEENQKLNNQLKAFETAKKQKTSGSEKLIIPANGKELHEREQYDLIVTAISQYEKNSENDTRAKDLAKDLLDKNPLIGTGKDLYPKIENILKSSPEINESAEKKLKELGFEIDRSKAGHIKSTFKETKYKFDFPTSPSAQSSPETKTQHIRKRLSVYRD